MALYLHPCEALLHLAMAWGQIASLLGQTIADLRSALTPEGRGLVNNRVYDRYVCMIVEHWLVVLDRARDQSASASDG